MPATYFDAQGNKVENVPTLEEINAFNADMAAKQAKVDEYESELSKLRSKDNNFAALRNASKEEKARLLSQVEEDKRSLVEKLDDLQTQIDTQNNQRMESKRKQALDQIAGSDQDFRKKVEEAEKSLIGTANTDDEIAKRYNMAVAIAKSTESVVNPMNRFSPGISVSDPAHNPEKKDFSQTQKGEEILRAAMPNIDWSKK